MNKVLSGFFERANLVVIHSDAHVFPQKEVRIDGLN